MMHHHPHWIIHPPTNNNSPTRIKGGSAKRVNTIKSCSFLCLITNKCIKRPGRGINSQTLLLDRQERDRRRIDGKRGWPCYRGRAVILLLLRLLAFIPLPPLALPADRHLIVNRIYSLKYLLLRTHNQLSQPAVGEGQEVGLEVTVEEAHPAYINRDDKN